MADNEVNDDYLPEEYPHEEQDDDTETEAEKVENIKTYTLCKEIHSLRGSRVEEKIGG